MASPSGSSREGKGKKTYRPPPTTAESSLGTGPALPPIFTPQGAPSLKRPRSNTQSHLPVLLVGDGEVDQLDPMYFQSLFVRNAIELEIPEFETSAETTILLRLFHQTN